MTTFNLQPLLQNILYIYLLSLIVLVNRLLLKYTLSKLLNVIRNGLAEVYASDERAYKSGLFICVLFTFLVFFFFFSIWCHTESIDHGSLHLKYTSYIDLCCRCRSFSVQDSLSCLISFSFFKLCIPFSALLCE